jgi:hypothetical protein
MRCLFLLGHVEMSLDDEDDDVYLCHFYLFPWQQGYLMHSFEKRTGLPFVRREALDGH